MKLVKNIAFVLVVVVALNAGLWGIFQVDLLGDMLGGPFSAAARTLFSLIGIAGLYWIWFSYNQHCCKKKK